MPRTAAQLEEIRIEKRTLILEKALQLFANQGYAKTSISQITNAAGISKGLIYNYFESKEALLKTLLNELNDEFSKNIDPNKDKIITEEEALNFVDTTFDLLKNKRNTLKCYLQLILQPEIAELNAKNNLINKTITEQQVLFINYLKTNNFKNQPKIAKTTIVSLIRGFVFSYIFYPQSFKEDFLNEYKEHLKETYIRKK